MSFCLILLAAGDSKRFNSKTPKPFIKVAGKSLLEHSLIKFNKIKQVKKVVVVINKKHSRFLNEILDLGTRDVSSSSIATSEGCRDANANHRHKSIAHQPARPPARLEIWKSRNLGIWKSRNVGSQKNQKIKILKIEICVAQNVAKVQICRIKTS